MVRYYNELTRLEMEQVDKDETVVMIPVGALEQHGNQCPLGTDEIIAEGTARRIKEALDREIPDYPMLIFPLIPVGLSTEPCELLRFCHLKAGYLLSCSLRHLQRPGASRIQEDRNLELPRRKLPDHPGLKQGGKK